MFCKKKTKTSLGFKGCLKHESITKYLSITNKQWQALYWLGCAVKPDRVKLIRKSTKVHVLQEGQFFMTLNREEDCPNFVYLPTFLFYLNLKTYCKRGVSRFRLLNNGIFCTLNRHNNINCGLGWDLEGYKMKRER